MEKQRAFRRFTVVYGLLALVIGAIYLLEDNLLGLFAILMVPAHKSWFYFLAFTALDLPAMLCRVLRGCAYVAPVALAAALGLVWGRQRTGLLKGLMVLDFLLGLLLAPGLVGDFQTSLPFLVPILFEPAAWLWLRRIEKHRTD